MSSSGALVEYPADMPWLVVEVKKQHFGVPCKNLSEMLLLPEVAGIPETPEYVRGVMNLRGRVFPVVDFRKRIGLQSSHEEAEEFCQLMGQRERDHQAWLEELEASVREHRPFKLARDPHLCAFGKWYYNYKAASVSISNLLKRFEVPHARIHSLADKVEQLAAKGDYDAAYALIDTARTGALAVVVGLFADLRRLMCEVQREIAVVLTVNHRSFAMSADCAISVEKLVPGSIEPLPHVAATGNGGVVQRFGRRQKQDQPLLLIETDKVLDSSLSLPAV